MKVSDVARIVTLKLGGQPPEELSPLDIVNEAGEHLVAMHDWNWTLKGPTDLNSTATQEYIALPADFGKIESLQLADSAVDRFSPTSPEGLNKLRENYYVNAPGIWFYTILWPLSSGIPTPRLELFPTPDSSTSPFASLVYRARWVKLTSDDDTIPIPPHVEGCLRQIAIALAESYVQQGVSREERLYEIEIGPTVRRAREQDGGAQSQHGRIRGGMIAGPSITAGILRSTVLPPS